MQGIRHHLDGDDAVRLGPAAVVNGFQYQRYRRVPVPEIDLLVPGATASSPFRREHVAGLADPHDNHQPTMGLVARQREAQRFSFLHRAGVRFDPDRLPTDRRPQGRDHRAGAAVLVHRAHLKLVGRPRGQIHQKDRVVVSDLDRPGKHRLVHGGPVHRPGARVADAVPVLVAIHQVARFGVGVSPPAQANLSGQQGHCIHVLRRGERGVRRGRVRCNGGGGHDVRGGAVARRVGRDHPHRVRSAVGQTGDGMGGRRPARDHILPRVRRGVREGLRTRLPLHLVARGPAHRAPGQSQLGIASRHRQSAHPSRRCQRVGVHDSDDERIRGEVHIVPYDVRPRQLERKGLIVFLHRVVEESSLPVRPRRRSGHRPPPRSA